MSIQMNIAEAKAKLSELVARAEAGEEVVLARGGKPVVKLAVVDAVDKPTPRKPRVPGLWAHLGPIDPDVFLRPDPEFLDAAESHDEDHFYRPADPAK